jgi:UDPglucose 6-dehydrogenase
MKITIIGSGYVGLVTGACLADMGNEVLCLDVDAAKIAALNAGRIPIFEPGLEVVVQRNRAAGRLRFSTDVAASVAHGELQFIAVGTPPEADGGADLRYVLDAARAIGRAMEGYRVIVNKSTVPVGTADRVRAVVAEALAERGREIAFSVVSNPEFLKEGAAVEDFMRPDRVIIGSDDARATQLLRQLYAPFQRNRERVMLMSVRSAELTKYAANAMLATRISFMNELARLAEHIGADIEDVRRGIGSDPRIGYQYLYPGAGFGGSCFPKDIRALQHTGQAVGMPLQILGAVERVNQAQKQLLGEKIAARLVLIDALVAAGARVRAYDPVAGEAAGRLYASRPQVAIADSAPAAAEGADALAIVTEWQEFRAPDFVALAARMKTPLIFDGRNLYDPAVVRAHGIEYFPIGRAAGKAAA